MAEPTREDFERAERLIFGSAPLMLGATPRELDGRVRSVAAEFDAVRREAEGRGVTSKASAPVAVVRVPNADELAAAERRGYEQAREQAARLTASHADGAWSPDTPDEWRSLVHGNLNGAAAAIRAMQPEGGKEQG